MNRKRNSNYPSLTNFIIEILFCILMKHKLFVDFKDLSVFLIDSSNFKDKDLERVQGINLFLLQFFSLW